MSKSTNQKPERQAHRTHTKRYWKAKGQQIETILSYSPENVNRMQAGYAPRRLAIVRHKVTGKTIETHVPVELHHVFGNRADTPQEDQTLVEVYPWQHAAMDPDRHYHWEFVQWVGFQ